MQDNAENTESLGYKTAEIIRKMIDSENNVINNRVTWLSTFEGLLFTALSFALSNKTLSHSFVVVFSLIGIFVALMSMWGTCGATQAMFELRLWHHENFKDYKGPPVVGLDPPFWSRVTSKEFGNSVNSKITRPERTGYFTVPWNLLPILLVWGWLTLLFVVQLLPLFFLFLGIIVSVGLFVVITLWMSRSWSKRLKPIVQESKPISSDSTVFRL